MFRQRKAKDKTKRQKNSTINEEQPSNCIICLDTVSCRGRLSVCKHWFCFHCIFEWSKNTNTCPICKTRFRCITKVHLNTLKSPPKKVRVGDRDQRVWNDDDDIVAGQVDLSEEQSSDDLDDAYDPSLHGFIDSLVTQEYYGTDDSFINDDDNDDDDDELILLDGGGTETSDSEECIPPRESPYLLRCSGPAVNVSLTDSILELVNEDVPNIGGVSHATMDSFCSISDDDLSDPNYEQWMPPRDSTQNSRNKSKHQKAVKEQTKRMGTRATKPARKVPKSQNTVRNQVSTRSKRKADDLSEEALSSGWINMNTRRKNMRTSSGRVSSRRCSTTTNQRGARQVSPDSKQTNDSIPSHLHNTHSSRPKMKGNSERTRLTSKELHTIFSEESDESDSDDFMPANNNNTGMQIGKESSSNQRCSTGLANKALKTSSEESDESDSDDMSMPSSSRSRTKVLQPSNRKEVTRSSTGYQDSHESDALDYNNISLPNRTNRSKESAGKKTGSTANSSMPVGIQDWNKENQDCAARKEKRQCNTRSTTPCAHEENCIAPTPQLHRYHSIFTKRRHRSPTYTFEDSEDSCNTKGCTHSQLPHKTNMSKTGRGTSHVTRRKLCKLAEDANDEVCVANAQTCLQQGDSPLLVRNYKKKMRLVNSDSESD